jgi:N-acetylglutamate synthase-like GNAT family acetyltransferase
MPNPKLTGISSITGKTVTIRHATESDMVFVEESIKKHHLDADDLDPEQFVVAAENGDIIGFGRLRKNGDIYDIGCVVVIEQGRRRGIGASIVRHLIEYAPVSAVYVVTDLVDYFKRLGFTEAKKKPKELMRRLEIACSVKGRPAMLLMSYDKK